MPDILPEFITLATRDGRIGSVLAAREKTQLEKDILPKFLPLQRWFGEKGLKIDKVELEPIAEIEQGQFALTVGKVSVGETVFNYALPLSARWGDAHLAFGSPKLSYTMAKLRRGSKIGALIDGAQDEGFASALMSILRTG